MILILSPAKSLDFESKPHISQFSQPEFINESKYLVGKLKNLSLAQIGELMKISPVLSDLNHQRFQEWSSPFSLDNSKQAALSFTGEVYRGLNANTMTKEELNFAQSHLRILSGLYGIIKPLDLIQPYRLEMGSRFLVSKKIKNLYAYWQEKITASLKADLDGQPLVNLASLEYSKAVKLKELDTNIVTPAFKEFKNGEYKTIMTYAKKARGLMAKYVISNQISEIDDLKHFDLDGYNYSQTESSEWNWVYTRG